MNGKEELDKLIKELSEKNETYKTSSVDSLGYSSDLGIPDLIPVDFDLTKKIDEEIPVVSVEETIEPMPEVGFISRIKNMFSSFKSPNTNLKFKIGLPAYLNKLLDFIKRKPVMSLLIILVMLVIIGFGVFSSGCSLFNSGDGKMVNALAPLNKDNGDESLLGSDRINILLLGIDSPNGKFNERSDTIILLSLDPKTQKISALSIPRDSYVNIPGHGKDKINAANEIGGPELVVKTISNLLAVQIDYYAVTNFNGFTKIIDTLGGVELDVEKNMYYRTYNGTINLKKGLQRLDGDKALQYVRFRHDALGDISRTQRQQKFILALSKEIMKPKTLLKLPKLLPEVSASVKTDLALNEMLSLVTSLKSFDLKNINTQTLPGNFVTIKGLSYWYVDEAQAKQVVLDVFVGKTSDEIIDPSLRPKNSDPVKTKPKKETQIPVKTQQPPKQNNDSSVNKGTYQDTVKEDTYTNPANGNNNTIPSDTNNNNQPNETNGNSPNPSEVPQNNTTPEQVPTPNDQNQTESPVTDTESQPSTSDQVY